MKNSVFSSILFSLLFAAGMPASAAGEFNPDSPEEFLANCSLENLERVPGEIFGICVGFVEGLTARENVALNEKAYCPENTPSRADGLRTLVEYIRNHPERRDESTALLALRAFSEAFPCEEEGQ